MSGLDEADPRSIARWAKKLGKELGDEASDDWDSMVEQMLEEELSGAGDFGVPADPVTAACPVGYCWRCAVLDIPEGCPDLLCLNTTPHQASQGQCETLCDAGSDASANDANSDGDVADAGSSG